MNSTSVKLFFLISQQITKTSSQSESRFDETEIRQCVTSLIFKSQISSSSIRFSLLSLLSVLSVQVSASSLTVLSGLSSRVELND